MEKKILIIKHGAGAAMPEELKKMMNDAFGEDGVKESDQDPEEQEVDDTKNPVLKVLRSKLNQVEEILEGMDSKYPSEEELDKDEDAKEYTDSLEQALDEFIEKEDDKDGE